ncbi:UvrD-helicase domain-containing protein [Sorangium sp. So ce362]|uniref:UvrD-helicase domain-containing protein n=1 Tax=Sorangium sp. So ce362 TaxID=3133303 RepID=UPI003F61569B
MLDADQQTVVTARPGARQLVEAGPGCGKTHVACARVAHLLDAGEVPERILLLSFTRTAVHELRNRIAGMARRGASLARGVEIRTLDSLAWRVATGTRETGPVGSYSESIESAMAALQRARSGQDPELAEYVYHFSHVFVDEAQDLVGVRAALVIELLNALRAEAGWTVFLDPAQAIYGWSTDAGSETDGERFIDVLGRLDGKISRPSLVKVHRTSNAALLGLLAGARGMVMDTPRGERLAPIRSLLSTHAAPQVLHTRELAPVVDELATDAERSLVLFRRRVDALLALSYLRSAGLICRLRLGGLPRVAAPWIASVSNALVSQGRSPGSISRGQFDHAWAVACSDSWLARDWTAEQAWNLLLRMGATGTMVDLRKVANRLAATVVPDEAFTRELGPGGPIVGTVHGSKGREAHRVVFCLPDDDSVPTDIDAADEEARVMYVAASRAISSLEIRRHKAAVCGYHEDRAWHSTHNGLQVEIGREGDTDPVWGMLMKGSAHATSIQERLASFDGMLASVHVNTDRGGTWTRQLEIDDGKVIGALSHGCGDALRSVVSARARRRVSAPMRVGHLTWLDVTTVALGQDHSHVERLPFPWRDTRLVLAPVIAGMGFIKRYW